MHLKSIIAEDYSSYKLPALFLGTCYCDFKCTRENSLAFCCNYPFWGIKSFFKLDDDLIREYLENRNTRAVVLGGLEPFYRQREEVFAFCRAFRAATPDDIVIYTGYYPEEISDCIETLRPLGGVFLKCGRYTPGQKPHYDKVLGVELASNEQFGISL